MTAAPRPPAHVLPYVEVLGTDGAVELLLELGGAEVYFAEAPTGRGRLAEIVGVEAAARLAEAGTGPVRRVPLAKRWIAQVLAAQGTPVAEIARRLHVSDVTVRGYLREGRRDPRQGTLL